MKSIPLTISLIFGSLIIAVLSQSPTPAQEPAAKDQAATDAARQKANRDFLRNASRRPDFNHREDPRQLGRRPQISGPTAIRPSSEQKLRLSPGANVVSKYSDLLKRTNAQLVKLFPDLDCVDRMVVRTDKPCVDYIPYSSFYSFRKESYSDRWLSDIGFKNDLFFTDGLLSNGFIVSLGDRPLESVTTSTDGMQFLTGYETASQVSEIVAKGRQMAGRVRSKGHEYGWTAPVRENMTYGIRVIAYRGRMIRTTGRYFYNALDGDKRVDIVVVFRVVSKDSDGSITLLWRELGRKKAPKIQVAKRK